MDVGVKYPLFSHLDFLSVFGIKIAKLAVLMMGDLGGEFNNGKAIVIWLSGDDSEMGFSKLYNNFFFRKISHGNALSHKVTGGARGKVESPLN